MTSSSIGTAKARDWLSLTIFIFFIHNSFYLNCQEHEVLAIANSGDKGPLQGPPSPETPMRRLPITAFNKPGDSYAPAPKEEAQHCISKRAPSPAPHAAESRTSHKKVVGTVQHSAPTPKGTADSAQGTAPRRLRPPPRRRRRSTRRLAPRPRPRPSCRLTGSACKVSVMVGGFYSGCRQAEPGAAASNRGGGVIEGSGGREGRDSIVR